MNKDVQIGLTGIFALVVLFLGIKFLKGMTIWNTNDEYYIVFSNAKGLSRSSAVYADGFKIGIVEDVTYDYQKPGQVVVEISVDPNVKMPHGTIARLDEAMLGGCTLNLTLGANPMVCYAPGDTLKGADASGLMDAAANVMPQVELVLQHVDSLIQALNVIANNPHIDKVLANTEDITSNLSKSSVQLNHLLEKDVPALTSTFNKAGENAVVLTENLAALDLKGTLDKVDAAMTNVNEATAQLSAKDNNIGLLLNDTMLYTNLNTTVNSATYLLEDMKAHPSRYVHFSVFGKKDK